MSLHTCENVQHEGPKVKLAYQELNKYLFVCRDALYWAVNHSILNLWATCCTITLYMSVILFLVNTCGHIWFTFSHTKLCLMVTKLQTVGRMAQPPHKESARL